MRGNCFLQSFSGCYIALHFVLPIRESGMPARIGLIIPASNRMVEQEMVRHLPPGVVMQVMRLRMTGEHRGTLEALLPQVRQAAGLLLDARCDVVAFHCTANSTAD